MAKKAKGSIAKVRASVTKARRSGVQMVERLRADAAKLVARSRTEVLKDVRALHSELRQRADHGLRELERRLMRQLHAASQEQVRRLERRVAKLERRIAELPVKPPTVGGEKAA
jgi:hypothetical protein